MFAYVAPLQMKKFRRSLWPFSTRAVEGVGTSDSNAASFASGSDHLRLRELFGMSNLER